jgi:hypothetical protein
LCHTEWQIQQTHTQTDVTRGSYCNSAVTSADRSCDAMSWLTASQTCPTLTLQKQQDCAAYLYLASHFVFFGLYRLFTATINKKTADSNHTHWIRLNVLSQIVFTVFCIVCAVLLYCFIFVYLFLFVLSVLA